MIRKGFLRKSFRSLYYSRDKKIPLPVILMVEPTNVCNLKCSMCYVQQQPGQKHYLSLPSFEHIINQFPRIRELIFCGIGEPLLNKDIFEMIGAAKKKGIAFINLVTNGKLLNEETIKKILASGINRMQISVHSFNPDKFSKIRNEEAGNLQELKENIKRLIALKEETHSHLKVCCNAVVNKFNCDDLLNFVQEAKNLGIDRVEFIQMTTASGNLKDINAPLHNMPFVVKEIRKAGLRLNIEVGFLSGNDYGRCYQLWDFIMVHSSGDISPCNGIFPTENIGLGNILNTSLEQIWNSEKYRNLRQSLIKEELEYCRYCESGYCLEGKNLRWFKNYYLRPLKRLIKTVHAR